MRAPWPQPAVQRRPSCRTEEDERGTELVLALSTMPLSDPDRPNLRERAIEAWLPMAHRLARRYARRGEMFDDLAQTAVVGLIKAVDGFEADRGVEFPGYAVPTIVGEIKRHFRDRTWGTHVYRRLQNLTLEVGSATAELTHTLARDPTAAEIARHLEVSEEQVRHAQLCAASQLPATLNAPIDDRGHHELGDLLGGPDEELDTLPDRLAIAGLLRLLPARIQRIITLRFYGDRTQTQIAEELGISQMQVSRLLRHALTWLRIAMLSDTTPEWTATVESESPPTLQVEIRKTKTEIIVEVVGEIDRDNAAHLSRRLRSALSLASPRPMVINLAGAPMVDVTGAAVLREGYLSADAVHVAMTFEGLQPLVGSVLAIVGLPVPTGDQRFAAPATGQRLPHGS